MKMPEISLLADALLSQVPRDPKSPHYTEESFRRKLGNQTRRESQLPIRTERQGALDLYRNEWCDVTEAAGLTERQSEVVQMRLSGHTFEQIGETFGHSKQGAQNIFMQAAKKLARAWISNPYRGLPSVYEQECRRGLRPQNRDHA
jgi:DNA-directed RNA polymerase sigma subunit (sigma70/sigma32)